MNMMTTIPTSGAATMSSLEIAELTGKTHGHVMRDIRTMLDAIGADQSRFGSVYRDAKGETRSCFALPYDETITLVAGYDAALRFKIVKRWRELEQTKPALPNFSNPAEAARAWADEVEAKQLAQAKVVELEPLAAVGELAVSHTQTLNRVVRAMLPKVNSMAVKGDLKREGFCYAQSGTYRVYAKHQDKFAERIIDEHGRVDIIVLPKGKQLLAQLDKRGRLTRKVKHR